MFILHPCGEIAKSDFYMAQKIKDLTGQVFGRLTVLELDHKEPKKQGGTTIYWRCRCSCGKFTIVSRSNLERGKAKSCGCLSREASITHNLSGGKNISHVAKR